MICCLVRISPNSAPGALEAIGRACSPRVESHGPSVVIFDADGLGRVVGTPSDIAREVSQLAVRQGLMIRVALAPTSTAAWLLAHATNGAAAVVARPDDATIALSGLPLRWLATLPDRWIFQGPGPRETGTWHLARGTGSKSSTFGPRPFESLRVGLSSVEGRQARAALSSSKGEVGSSKFGATRSSSRHYRMAPGPALSAVERPSLVSSAPRGSIGGRSDRHADTAQDAVFDLLATFERWGLRTLGDVARLPRADVHTRLGAPGVRLHQAAWGEETAWLVPADDAPRFVERCVLDWPVEGLEPLSFVLARVLDPLSAALERADRGAVEVTTRLQVVTRESHVRVLHLPAPLRDARVLRTLILLDLESHPPPAGIDIVEVEAGVVPGRIAQGALLTRTLPSPEDLSTLIARLGALMGESRVGAPALVDTFDERPVAMRQFAPRFFRTPALRQAQGAPSVSRGGTLGTPGTTSARMILRRFRFPVAARVQVERGAPIHVSTAVATGEVVSAAGPWRSSGFWWALDGAGWDRDEWDVELTSGVCLRLARNRTKNDWHVEGQID